MIIFFRLSDIDMQQFSSSDSVPAKGFSATLLTRQAVPYGVELVGSGIDQRRVVCEDSRLEITRRSPFHAEPRAGQVPEPM